MTWIKHKDPVLASAVMCMSLEAWLRTMIIFSQTYCQDLGARMVKIESDAENTFVVSKCAGKRSNSFSQQRCKHCCKPALYQALYQARTKLKVPKSEKNNDWIVVIYKFIFCCPIFILGCMSVTLPRLFTAILQFTVVQIRAVLC